jgi:hypothetical protein
LGEEGTFVASKCKLPPLHTPYAEMWSARKEARGKKLKILLILSYN